MEANESKQAGAAPLRLRNPDEARWTVGDEPANVKGDLFYTADDYAAAIAERDQAKGRCEVLLDDLEQVRKERDTAREAADDKQREIDRLCAILSQQEETRRIHARADAEQLDTAREALREADKWIESVVRADVRLSAAEIRSVISAALAHPAPATPAPNLRQQVAEMSEALREARLTPTWQCVNCSTVDEFSVQHCAPDKSGAVYPVIECHVCGLVCSDQRGEQARALAHPSPASASAAEVAELECGAQGHEYVGDSGEQPRCRFCGAYPASPPSNDGEGDE